jgi:hypothetical protein
MAAIALNRGIRKKNEVHIKFDFKFEFEPPQQPEKKPACSVPVQEYSIK